MELQIRKFKQEDFSFVISSWSKSYKLMSYFAKKIPHQIYFKWHPRIIENILAKPMVNTLIACSESDPDEIFGYLVYSALRSPDEDKQTIVIHYLFVKLEFQKLGIGKRLTQELKLQESDEMYFTHWTYPMDEITLKHPKLTYNPYLI